MTAFEIGYTGVLMRRATVTAAVYWNTTDDAIFFTQVGSLLGGQPACDVAGGDPDRRSDLIPPPGLPSVFTYRNLGTVNDKGIELGVDGVVNRYLNVIVNYSYQADPEVEGFDPSETNLPANNRFNAGFNFNYARFLGNFNGQLHRRCVLAGRAGSALSPAPPTPSRW